MLDRSKAPLQWLAEDYGTLKEEHRIMECMQRPGEVIYVPSSWGHAVLNTADSIGFSGEFKVYRCAPLFRSLAWIHSEDD